MIWTYFNFVTYVLVRLWHCYAIIDADFEIKKLNII